jgi:hypothetical protein
MENVLPSSALKLLLFPPLLVAGCLVAGLYGALHDQISYSVSPDYFHELKFDQFGIPASQHRRLGAAIVGWWATWWMGFLIGVPLMTVGLILPGWKNFLRYCLKSFVVVAATALIFGVGALVVSYFTIDQSSVSLSPTRSERVADKVAFARVGVMHEFSYLGGFVGIVTGSAYLVIVCARFKRRLELQ